MNQVQRKNGGSPSKFRLDHAGGKLAGVCGGIANYFNIDPLIVRIVFTVGTIAGFGLFALVYLAIWLLAE